MQALRSNMQELPSEVREDTDLLTAKIVESQNRLTRPEELRGK
jgi:hypothetical protein